MNAPKFSIIILSIVVLFSACQKEPDPKPLPEPGYPTTYSILTQQEWTIRNSEFQEINIHEGLILNEFGFVEGVIPLNENDSINEELVIHSLNEIIDQYREFLGIENGISIDLKTELKIHIPTYVGGSISGIEYYFKTINEFKKEEIWHEFIDLFMVHEFQISQKYIANRSYLGTTLFFNFNEMNKTLQISGNWFPEAIDPVNEIYNEGDAISIVYRVMLEETGIDFWERKQNFQSSKLFVFKYAENSIEIRKCWKISVPENEGITYVYVDTQTGEVVGKCIGCYYM